MSTVDDDDRDDSENYFEIKNDLQKAIADSFSLFLNEDNENIIEVSHLGKVIHHLGCVPSREEMTELVGIVVDKENPNTVKLSVFLPYMEAQIIALRYKPGTTIELFEAFRTLDVNNEGVLSADLVREILRGEFDDDVIDRVIKSVYDPILEAIPYDVWVNKLVGKNKMDVYALIPVEQAKKPAEKPKKKTEQLNSEKTSSQ